jgi:hypothetical protein
VTMTPADAFRKISTLHQHLMQRVISFILELRDDHGINAALVHLSTRGVRIAGVDEDLEVQYAYDPEGLRVRVELVVPPWRRVVVDLDLASPAELETCSDWVLAELRHISTVLGEVERVITEVTEEEEEEEERPVPEVATSSNAKSAIDRLLEDEALV